MFIPKTLAVKLESFHFPLLLILGFWSLLPSFFIWGQEGSVKHYQSFRSAGNASVAVDHFEAHGQLLSFELSPNWELMEGSGELLAQAYYRANPTIFIRFLVLSQDHLPADLTSADKFYTGELLKIDSLNVIKGGDDAGLTDKSLLAKVYSLADTRESFPRAMATFFIKPPFYYKITIEFPEKFIGQPRQDYQNMLQSITLEISPSPSSPSDQESHATAPPLQETNAPPPTATP